MNRRSRTRIFYAPGSQSKREEASVFSTSCWCRTARRSRTAWTATFRRCRHSRCTTSRHCSLPCSVRLRCTCPSFSWPGRNRRWEMRSRRLGRRPRVALWRIGVSYWGLLGGIKAHRSSSRSPSGSRGFCNPGRRISGRVASLPEGFMPFICRAGLLPSSIG